MAIFEEVFNKESIYSMLFFSIKSVLNYPNLEELEKNDKQLFDRWKNLINEKNNMISYADNAPNYPEFCKIIAITYGTIYLENGVQKRSIKRIVNSDEFVVIAQFMEVLDYLSNEGIILQPQFFPALCGHNIISHDIPLLIKRFLLHTIKSGKNKELPYILKKCLDTKPWESSVIDTQNVWKFNGYGNTPLMLIADYLNLKKTVNLLTESELSKYYWENITEKPNETFEYISLQSATQMNFVMQLMKILREF